MRRNAQLQFTLKNNPIKLFFLDEDVPSTHYQAYECTQVDNGEYSDDDVSEGGGDMFGATQVDDDYLRRMAESDELLGDEEEVADPQEGGVLVRSQQNEVFGVPTGSGATEPVGANSANVSEQTPINMNTAEYFPTRKATSDVEQSDSEEEDSEGNFVDFCIADTQQPPSRHNSTHQKQSSVTSSNQAVTNAVELVSVAAGSAAAVTVETTAAPEPNQEETGLSVYDYLSMSAPLSNNDGKAEVNVFSALDAIPPPQLSVPGTAKTNNTVSSAAFATAQTSSIYVTHPVGKAVALHKHGNHDGEEEEPTQLDGSSVRLSGDSHPSIPSSSRNSGSHSHDVSSHSTGEHSDHSVLLSPELLLQPATAPAVDSPVVVAATAAAVGESTVSRADTGGEWLSVKNIKSNILPPMPPALPRQSPLKASLPTPSTSAESNQAHAGESETQVSGLGFPVENDSQALADALEEKSLEELVRMQEKLSKMINSKIQKTASPTAVVAASAAFASPAASCASKAAPLERQQTSYGLSQPSNLAVSSLMLLKSTVGPVTIGSSSSDAGSATVSANGGSPAGQRKFTTFSASGGLAAVTPAGSNIGSSRGGASGLSTGSTTATGSPSPTNADGNSSNSKKFLKRKFGRPQSHVQALTAVVEDANLQFEMSEGSDSDVASPHSSDDERHRNKKEKVSPSKLNKKREDKAAAASSKVVASKSKVRRIVIEDTQDDHQDEHDPCNDNNDEDAEFTADYFVSSPQAARHSTVASNKGTTTSQSGGSNPAREALIAKALPADFPTFLLQGIPEKFVDLWHSLTDLGWFWKRGGGIVSYYYVRPNCLVKKGFLMGRDYFGDEQEVIKFVSKVVKDAKAALLQQGIDVNPVPSKPKPVAAPAPVASNTTTSATTTAIPSNASSTQTTTHSKIPASRQLVPQFSTVSVTSGLLPPDDPIMSDIRKIPWKWLWKMLRERNWSWDFGPAHTNFYFTPGYTIRSKNAVLGEHKFDSEEGVRRYVRKQNWPEFSKGNEKQSQSGAESQLPDAYLKDPNWGLASHRQKRDVREARFGGDNNSTSDNESNEESAQKASASRKKIAKSGGVSNRSLPVPSSKVPRFTPEQEETEQATQAQVSNVFIPYNLVVLFNLLCFFFFCFVFRRE